MHGPTLATLMVGLLIGSVDSTGPDAIVVARRKLDDRDGAGAVAVLESALPVAGAEKEALLVVLRDAYEAAATQAEAAGRPAEAETYRENRKILARRSKAAKAPLVAPSPAPPVAVAVDAPPPALLPDGPTAPIAPEPTSPPPMEFPPTTPRTVAPPVARPVESSAEDLAAADAAFVAKEYLAAGELYAKLARKKQLPAERRDQWLYCRAFQVVARINARPKDDAEWAAIKIEIEQARALNPNNLLGEYIRDLANERQALARKAKAPKTVVVRGSAPEEPPAVDRPVRSASSTTPTATATAAVASRVGANSGRWQVVETANFRIFHADPALATKVAQAAEVARREQLKKWAKTPARPAWTPLCEVYLYPTAKQYAQMTGQPEDSPGFSTMGMNAGRITSRRINLRVDHPTLVQAVLPHEITHVILADHFTEQQIPRWADEGLAVLAEPLDEQRRRADDLRKPLADNRIFPLDVLMGMDYPDDRYWALYYAQSVSLSRFLVEQGSPAQMIQFLQESQKEGFEPVLRRIYQIDGVPDLQRRWLDYARAKGQGGPARDVVATPSTTVGPDLKVR